MPNHFFLRMELIKQAQELIKEEQFEKALTILKKVRDEDPTEAITYKLMGDCYHHFGKFERVVRYWTKAKRLGYTDDALDAALMTHSLKIRADKEPEEVIENKECLDKFEKGNVFLKEEKLDDAIKAYDEAIKIAPEYITPVLNKALILYQKKDIDGAITLTKNALEKHSTHAIAWFNLGTYYIKKEDWERAIPALKKATELNSEDGEFWFNLGFAHAKSGQFEKAIPYLEEAELTSPWYALPLWQLALCHANLKHKKEALYALHRALLSMPGWKPFAQKEEAFKWFAEDEKFKKIAW